MAYSYRSCCCCSIVVRAQACRGVRPGNERLVFFGQVELDPVKAKLQFSDVAEEVLMLFTSKPGVKVKVSLEIQAEAPTGFDESTQRAARENCNQLKFKNHGFED